ncbi:hypothetical protein M407DRAFT_3503 [Tulasnella calospora MUT 4182]|uniref:Uncharacterized protein n=1 Tax=Tulasnella calospora MUT 4182 TaxID=1051891 RepID=A0A0C3QWU1_9AGAM|nr:hypothetical protein M407DRAFT_3503 [Tulasnella calospora MUT 4182]
MSVEFSVTFLRQQSHFPLVAESGDVRFEDTMPGTSIDHPIHKDVDHDKRKWKFNPGNPEYSKPTILRLDTEADREVTDLFEIIDKHASPEVSFLLERSLPAETEDKLQEMLLKADLLAEPVSDAPDDSTGEEEGSEDEATEPGRMAGVPKTRLQ